MPTMMKKLATTLVALGISFGVAAPAVACPHDDKPAETDAPKTADKTPTKKKAPAKKKEAPKKKEGAKTGDKVTKA